tara:strand:+ start:1534 stop:1875 length:342 start_codon:yes stop_codon:yes gene_type:complete
MVCLQILIYIGIIVIQTLISTFIFKFPIKLINLVSPLLVICFLGLLCYNNYYTFANIIVGLVAFFSILTDILALTNPKIMNTLRNLQKAKDDDNTKSVEKLQQQLNVEIKNKF